MPKINFNNLMIKLFSILRSKNNFYPAILIIISLILCFKNYAPATSLSGWDTLHPEFNYGIYWERITQSVWQEHQGLGAVATQAHASEIPRIIILYFLDLFFSTSAVRWIYFFLMLVIGPLGIYYLSTYLFGNKKDYEKYAFVAALFYLLNLGTLQHFYVPLEMFATLYGYIAWIFLFAIKYLDKGKNKHLIIFSVFAVLSMPMAHTPTLWFVFAFMFALFVLTYLVLNRKNKTYAKRGTLLLTFLIVINSFWILPTTYFVNTHANDVTNAKITRLFSEEAILHNKEYSTIKNISLFKGFMFNWSVHRGSEEFTPIFNKWYEYYNNVNIIWFGYITFIISAFGLLISIIKKDKKLTSFVLITIVSIFFLMMDTGPFGFLYDLLQGLIPILKEAIRLPYTKFSIPLMFATSLFFGYGMRVIGEFLDGFFKTERFEKSATSFLVLIISITLIIYAFPMFQGNLIGDIEKVKFPKYYTDAFNYMNSTEDSRIATLPTHFLFGWIYYDWGNGSQIEASYQGAGFTWFMSKNPILEREFDRWFETNEEFYNEFQYAIYSQDVNLLSYLVNKYQLNYLLLDESIIAPNVDKSLFIDQTKSLIKNLSNIEEQKEFEKLTVYKIKQNSSIEHFVYAPSSYNLVDGSFIHSNIDSISLNNNSSGSYVNSTDGTIYPFKDDKSLTDNSLENIYTIESPNLSVNYSLSLPNINISNNSIPTKISKNENGLIVSYLYPIVKNKRGKSLWEKSYTQELAFNASDNPSLLINDSYINSEGFGSYVLLNSNSKIIAFDESKGLNIDYASQVYSAEPSDCLGGKGAYGKSYDKYANSVILTAKNKNICLDFSENIINKFSAVYKISFDYKSDVGSRVLYCLSENDFSECLNKKYKNAPLQSNQYSNYIDYVFVENPSETQLQLILETDDKENLRQGYFKNLKIDIFPVINGNFSVSNNVSDSKSHNLLIDQTDYPVSIEFPSFSGLNYFYQADSSFFNSTSRNCDNFNEKEFDRELIDGAYRYSAIDAISCDTLNTRNIDVNADYLITFDSKHIEGKGLDVCIAGVDLDKCLIQDRLKGSGLESFILPSYPSAKSVVVNIGNQSIGRVKTVNDLSSVSVKYLPYKWLKGIYLKPVDEPDFYVNGVKLVNVDKKAIFKYEVMVEGNLCEDLDNVADATGSVMSNSPRNGDSSVDAIDANGIALQNTPQFARDFKDGSNQNYEDCLAEQSHSQDVINQGLIILNQSFEKGWGLYDKSSCLLGITTPVTCKKANVDHVLANNWANAWRVPATSATYLIIFWPQYLQFLGYGILIATIIVIGIRVVLKRVKRKNS